MLHPERMGIATHASFFINKPTIGVGKSFFKFNGSDYIMPENKPGAFTYIKDGAETVGAVLRTQVDVKPVFVSAGNFITLDQSIAIVMNMITKESRLPIATRIADLETHKLRTEYVPVIYSLIFDLVQNLCYGY